MIFRPFAQLQRSFLCAALIVQVALAPGVSWAQTGVDAGTLRQHSETAKPALPAARQTNGDQIQTPASPASRAAPKPAPDAPTVFLRAWRFSGNTFFEQDALRDVLASVTGRSLTIDQLYFAAQLIEDHYAQAGFVAQATLPPQEVVNDTVVIHITEARFAGITFEGSTPERVQPGVITDIFDAHTPVGAPLRPADFDLPNLLANDLPGIALVGAFAPGAAPGETVLIVNTVDAPPVIGQMSIDNSGSRATGRERALIQLGLNSPRGLGDFVQADLSRTQGATALSTSYALPVSPNGARATFSAGLHRYDVVSPEMRSLDVSSESFSRGIKIGVPLRRSRDGNLNLTVQHDLTDLLNTAQGSVSSDYRVHKTSISLSGNRPNGLAQGGMTTFGVNVIRGRAAGEETAGAFRTPFDLLRMNAAQNQYLSQDTSIFGAFSGQLAPVDLDTSEQFSLGGPGGVRAYPIGEAGGPRGAVFNLELRHQINDRLHLTGFYDHGMVFGRSSSGEPSSYHLKGIGATISWSLPSGWGGNVTWAHRVGENPNPLTNPGLGGLVGNDQDGSLDRNRIWITARKSF